MDEETVIAAADPGVAAPAVAAPPPSAPALRDSTTIRDALALLPADRREAAEAAAGDLLGLLALVDAGRPDLLATALASEADADRDAILALAGPEPPADLDGLVAAAGALARRALLRAGLDAGLERTAQAAAAAVLARWIVRVGTLAREEERCLVPADLRPPDLLPRLVGSVRQGFGVDHEFLDQTRTAVRAMTTRAWDLLDASEGFLAELPGALRPAGWLVDDRTRRRLVRVGLWNHETALNEPEPGPLEDWRVRLEARVRRRLDRFPTATRAPSD